MRNLFLLVFISLTTQILIGQSRCNLITLDTTSRTWVGTGKRGFTGVLKDTIVSYKAISVDSIFCNNETNICDTVFLVNYFKKGWRYLENKLSDTDYEQQQYGYFFKGKQAGYWNYTGGVPCFSEGTILINKAWYFNGFEIPDYKKDKYYFINDSLSGELPTMESELANLTDCLNYKCIKDKKGDFTCKITLSDGRTVSEVKLAHLKDEVYLIFSGYYNWEIKNKK